MNKHFSLKLAVQNIRKNRKFYLPYSLASVGIIAMFYIIVFLASSRDISDMSESLAVIMGMGVGIMAIFSFIFLFYTNSFLMKRRKKEIGLYNILGMEKRHIGRILFIENFIVWAVSLILGLLCGVLFSKLILLFVSYVFAAAPPFGISVSGTGLSWTAMLFGALFLLTCISNQMSIRLTRPAELLRGGNVGEKEPKAKLPLALIGFVCLGAGYYIALTTDDPLSALLLFFVAVVLVIVGTYCLFVSGSIAVLKAMKKNRKFYYRPGNFTAISGMIYRMKQNAVGLANICILSTMVLVMVSGTVSLYFGKEDTLKEMVPGDAAVNVFYDEASPDERDADARAFASVIRQQAETDGVEIEKIYDYECLPMVAVAGAESDFTIERATADNMDKAALFGIMTEEDYTAITGKQLGLSVGETAVDSRYEKMPEEFSLGGESFTVKKELKPFVEVSQLNGMINNTYYVVVADEDTLRRLYTAQAEVYGDSKSYITRQFNVFAEGSEDAKTQFSVHMRDSVSGVSGMHYETLQISLRTELEESYGGLVNGFLFLGVFLGVVFTFAAALIIYYKQISEGYYDKDKFEIMQKVGMSRAEVKRTIRKQVLMVFFLPLLMAGLHIAMAFKMITKLLMVFSMTNIPLFALCTLATFGVFAVIYALVYIVTAREYYKIVG